MKYSVATNLGTVKTVPVPLGGDSCEQMRKAKAMGYDAIEIHVPDVSVLDMAALKQTMEETGMCISTLGTGTIYGKFGLHLCDENEENQERLYGMVCRFIDAAAELGSRVTIGSIKGNIRADQDREKHLNILGKALRKIDEYAKEKGVVVLLEGTNRYENNVLNRGSEIAQMIRDYKLESTKALVDVFHMNIEEKDPCACILENADVIGHIHFADNNRLYPGAGCFAFAQLAGAIRSAGYDGMLSVECLPLPTGEEAAKKACDFLHGLFD